MGGGKQCVHGMECSLTVYQHDNVGIQCIVHQPMGCVRSALVELPHCTYIPGPEWQPSHTIVSLAWPDRFLTSIIVY